MDVMKKKTSAFARVFICIQYSIYAPKTHNGRWLYAGVDLREVMVYTVPGRNYSIGLYIAPKRPQEAVTAAVNRMRGRPTL